MLVEFWRIDSSMEVTRPVKLNVKYSGRPSFLGLYIYRGVELDLTTDLHFESTVHVRICRVVVCGECL